MKVRHIDNSFFHLTTAQARELCIDGKLPREGHEKKADPAKVAKLELTYIPAHEGAQEKPCASKPTEAREMWVTRTRLSYWDGKPVKSGSVWALRLWFAHS